jgi:4-amino-4-deoxy-L-arabinose transferase-like glycosyltransferase
MYWRGVGLASKLGIQKTAPMEAGRRPSQLLEVALEPAAWPVALIVVVLGGVALAPRMIGLADFATTDEVYNWIPRVERFSDAIANQRWGATVLVGHPGITLCWLASLGLRLEQFAVAHDWARVTSQIDYMRWLRMPLVALEVVSVPLGYLLLRRLVRPAIALLAALLWATSPYLIAHSRLLHLDALLTTFVTFTILCVLIACRGDRPLRWMIAAGCCAGLALLTKGPALILLPIVGLLLIADCRLQIADFRSWQSLISKLKSPILRYLIWLGVAALMFALLWPAMWVDPGHALRSFFGLIVQNGGRPNGDGQFFLGRAVGDPGPLFYLVADLFRMTPVTLIGLLGAPLALWPRTTEPRTKNQEPRTKHRFQASGSRLTLRVPVLGSLRWSEEQRVLLALTAFVAIWTLVMTIGLKKFDRYTLPTWPALLVLSAAGWRFWLWDGGAWLRERWPKLSARVWGAVRGLVLAGALAFQLGTLAYYHPYYLSYYNPLLGGGPAAQRALLIGWGEGMDQVGAYLSTRPDIQNGPVVSALPRTLRPFVPVLVKDIIDINDSPANYVVVYLESIQRGASPEIYAAIRQTVPLHRITIHGIDYAEIYQLPKRFEQPIGAHFGDPSIHSAGSGEPALVLRGVTLKHESGRLVITPSWDVRGRLPADYNVFIHMIDSAGHMVAQLDVAPGGADGAPTSAWAPGQQIAVPLPLPLPDTLPPGTYQVILGLYDSRTGERLAFTGGTPAATDGPNALLLDNLSLP